MRLVLVRHAKAEVGDPSLPDHDRALAPRGLRDAPLVGAWLRDNGWVPGLALCSTARRTRETLDGMAIAWDRPPEARYLPALYHAAPEVMLAALARAGAPDVAIVGHNPGIAALMHLLAARAPDHPRWDDVPTGAALVLEFRADAWGPDLERTGRVLGFAVPADLG